MTSDLVAEARKLDAEISSGALTHASDSIETIFRARTLLLTLAEALERARAALRLMNEAALYQCASTAKGGEGLRASADAKFKAAMDAMDAALSSASPSEQTETEK